MQLQGKRLLLVGFTLFSMFFGAGNLIFPPFLGAQAGTSTWPAMAGFALSAIGFPILGVVAVARSAGSPSWPAGASALCSRLYDAHLSFHRALPRHPPHRQHLL